MVVIKIHSDFANDLNSGSFSYNDVISDFEIEKLRNKCLKKDEYLIVISFLHICPYTPDDIKIYLLEKLPEILSQNNLKIQINNQVNK
jgi:hypothetical protein